MPASDFRISIGFFSHPKIKDLHRRRGDGGVMALIRLYAFTALHYSGGVIPNMSAGDLASHIGRGSHFKKLIDDLLDLRLLDPVENGFKVHDWEDHQPWVANTDNRKKAAKKSATARWSAGEPANKSSRTDRAHAKDRSAEVSSPAVFTQSCGANPAESKEPADAPLPSNPLPSSPFVRTSTTSQQQKPSGEQHQDGWRNAIARFRGLVPPGCPRADRPSYLKALVDDLRGQGSLLENVPAFAADDIVSVFVPSLTEKSRPVAAFVRREWLQALGEHSEVATDSDSRASADDFMEQLQRDPSLLARDSEAISAGSAQ